MKNQRTKKELTLRDVITAIIVITGTCVILGLGSEESRADGLVSYDYLQAEVQFYDLNYTEEAQAEATGDGLKFSASRHVSRRVNVFGSYRLGDLQANNNATHKVQAGQIGAMYHRYLGGCAAVDASVSYNLYKVNSRRTKPGPNRFNRIYTSSRLNEGLDLTLGAGCRISNVELTAGVSKQVTGRPSSIDGIKYRAGLAIYITDNFSAVASYERVEFRSIAGLGFRVSF